MVIIGYQGIGKSTAAIKRAAVVDLDSSLFYIDNKRNPNWYKIYCNIAINLSSQGKMVFVSSHKEVRDYLYEINNNKEKIVLCYPSLSLKEEWIARLEKRYNSTGFDKDYRALMNTKLSFDKNITDLDNDNRFIKAKIYKTNYNLTGYIIHSIQYYEKNIQ